MDSRKGIEQADADTGQAEKVSEPGRMVNERLQEAFQDWITMTPPRRMIRNLRKMLISWMLHEQQSGFPADFEEMVTDVDGLFELLDLVEEGTTGITETDGDGVEE